MALWLVRAGSDGEHEEKFLTENRVYLTWDQFDRDLGSLDWEGILAALRALYPNFSERKVVNNASQMWAFAHGIAPGDWIALPSKKRPAINVAECVGKYTHHPAGPNPYFHYRDVKWIARDVPRSNFDQDLLYSIGAFLTVCQIKRNDAERRVREMAQRGWSGTGRSAPTAAQAADTPEAAEVTPPSDLGQVARDQIAKLIIAKFSGHPMARLVEAILEAKGYTTYRSPEGPDRGIDILAGTGPMGFGQPRICVQVKSGSSPLDRPTLDQLIGTMQNVHADHGLLVSWGGFKSSVDRDEALQFFRVRLWDQDDLINELLEVYEKIDDAIRAELPLKRIWTVAATGDSEAE